MSGSWSASWIVLVFVTSLARQNLSSGQMTQMAMTRLALRLPGVPMIRLLETGLQALMSLIVPCW
jgi:hypothetical protein